MNGPRIGIPLCLDAADRIRPGRRYHYIDEAYAAAVAEAGGTPCYLPLQASPEEALEGIDGLLLPGGDDFPPPRPYSAEIRFSLVQPEQRAFDAALLAGATLRALPVLGICYGMQLMALEAGGDLLHHIPVDRPDAEAHQLDESNGRHALRVETDTRLGEWLGTDTTEVNSLHHQAVAEVGAGYRVAARAPDGIIEAIEAESPVPRIGVQWHPEKLQGTDRTRLFRAFVDACREASGPASDPMGRAANAKPGSRYARGAR